MQQEVVTTDKGILIPEKETVHFAPIEKILNTYSGVANVYRDAETVTAIEQQGKVTHEMAQKMAENLAQKAELGAERVKLQLGEWKQKYNERKMAYQIAGVTKTPDQIVTDMITVTQEPPPAKDDLLGRFERWSQGEPQPDINSSIRFSIANEDIHTRPQEAAAVKRASEWALKEFGILPQEASTDILWKLPNPTQVYQTTDLDSMAAEGKMTPYYTKDIIGGVSRGVVGSVPNMEGVTIKVDQGYQFPNISLRLQKKTLMRYLEPNVTPTPEYILGEPPKVPNQAPVPTLTPNPIT